MDREFDAEEPTGTAWQRLGAVCGIAAVLALVAATLVVPQPPKADASTGKILAYYIGHRHTLLFSQWLAGLGTALFLWFAGSLRGAWARHPGSARELSAVAFGGGVVDLEVCVGKGREQLLGELPDAVARHVGALAVDRLHAAVGPHLRRAVGIVRVDRVEVGPSHLRDLGLGGPPWLGRRPLSSMPPMFAALADAWSHGPKHC